MKLAVGMRVAVADGPWPVDRIAGCYGKVSEITQQNGQDFIRIDVMGHADGGNPPDLHSLDIFPFYPEELVVVD